MEKIYRVKLNAKGAPNFATAEEVADRPQGEWKDKEGGLATCSVCGDRWGVWDVMNYCPSCGARMDAKK